MNYSKAERAAITRALNIIRENGLSEDREQVCSPLSSRRLMRLHFATLDARREHFVAAFLDTQHGVIDVRTMFSGTIDGAAVYPREIARVALELDAAAVILAHNHPSGTETPSAADRKVTARIRDGLALFDIRTLDHLILGAVIYSFAENGDL